MDGRLGSCSFRSRVFFACRGTTHEHLVDAPSVHIDHLETPPTIGDRRALLRHAAELGQDEPGERHRGVSRGKRAARFGMRLKHPIRQSDMIQLPRAPPPAASAIVVNPLPPSRSATTAPTTMPVAMP